MKWPVPWTLQIRKTVATDDINNPFVLRFGATGSADLAFRSAAFPMKKSPAPGFSSAPFDAALFPNCFRPVPQSQTPTLRYTLTAGPRQIVLEVGAGLALPERAPQAAPLHVTATGGIAVDPSGNA
jgi:hypothetical protein